MKKNIRFLSPQDLKHSRAFFELSLPRLFPWFLYGVGLLLFSAFLWAGLGEMEVMVKASGILRPVQNVSEVKTSVTGLVAEKHFTNGQKVEAGELLWTLGKKNVEVEISGLRLHRARQEKLLADLELVSLSYSQGLGVIPLGAVEARRVAELYWKEDERLSLLARQAQRALQQERLLPPSAQALSRTQELETDGRLAQGRLESYRLEQLQMSYEQRGALTKTLEDLDSRLVSLEQQTATAEVRAPIAGWVEEVKKFNRGDVVLAGELLLRVVPENARELKAELAVDSSDIAEVLPGMTFRLTFPKLPPSEFGRLEGTLVTVPQDAWLVSGGSPVFQLEGRLSRAWMENSQGRRVELKAGMVAEARIIVKKRPIWRFLLEKLDFLR